MVPRIFTLAACLMAAACGPAPAPQPKAQGDPTAEASYTHAVSELAALNREARAAFDAHKPDEAAALIERGEPLSKQLMGAPRPTLAATEAVSDLDRLYADMLFSNRNYGWARMLYQRNLSRWKYRVPQTPETERLRKQAEASMAECDRRIENAIK
jgi:hypothetical protein